MIKSILFSTGVALFSASLFDNILVGAAVLTYSGAYLVYPKLKKYDPKCPPKMNYESSVQGIIDYCETYDNFIRYVKRYSPKINSSKLPLHYKTFELDLIATQNKISSFPANQNHIGSDAKQFLTKPLVITKISHRNNGDTIYVVRDSSFWDYNVSYFNIHDNDLVELLYLHPGHYRITRKANAYA